MKKKIIKTTILFLFVNFCFSQSKENSLFIKAETLLSNKEYEKAIITLDKVLKINTNHVGANVYKGIINSYLKKYNEATLSFKKAISLDSFNTQALYEIANIYHKRNKINKAIKYYNMAENSLENIKTFYQENSLLKRTFLKEIFPFAVDKSEILYMRGVLYFDSKQYTLAYDDFSNIKFMNRNKDSQYMLATSLLKLKRKNEACNEFKKAIVLGSEIAKEMKIKHCTP
ncbi:tetratricopeptide repeat protein [Polaribacter sp.]|uniref:tetratricopeptide repeat protein n=1 Tax=Polaribacter sp. TaxID=1920175 RepID=UPI003F6C16AA